MAMTREEIAVNTIHDIATSCDIALGYGYWQKKAEEAVNDAFHVARDCKKRVTAVAKEIVNVSYSMVGERFGDLMSMAVGNTLLDWYKYNWLTESEKKTANKILEF